MSSSSCPIPSENEQPGFFGVIDGPEGAGKTTLRKLLVESLARELGRPVLSTAEPGGSPTLSPFTYRYRQVLLSDEAKQFLPPTGELLGMLAARTSHLEELIKPALGRGEIVICDRFSASTYAYQLRGRRARFGEDIAAAEAIFRQTLQVIRPQPDFYLWLDVDPQVGIARRLGEPGAAINHFDRESADFHAAVAAGYAEFFYSECEVPFVRVNANLSPEDVLAAALEATLDAIKEASAPRERQAEMALA